MGGGAVITSEEYCTYSSYEAAAEESAMLAGRTTVGVDSQWIGRREIGENEKLASVVRRAPRTPEEELRCAQLGHN